MFSRIRWLCAIAVCLCLFGVYRGWMSFTNPTRDPQSEKLNISVSVDTKMLRDDVQKVKARVSEKVAERRKQLEGSAQAEGPK